MTSNSPADRQRIHYDAILRDYDAHYGDRWSLEYRYRFFISPVLGDLNLDGLTVADVASGSGPTTTALKQRFPRSRLVGFDVSDAAVTTYRARTGCDGYVWDMTSGRAPAGPFDVVVVVGGLHHCARAVTLALINIAEMLKPGGRLLLVEPSRDTVFEAARRLWYRTDNYFEPSTEAALSHAALIRATDRFSCDFVRHMGGPAYFLVYNSLVFRIPLGLKRRIAPPLMALEALTNQIPLPWVFPYFVARWTKR